MENFLGYFYEVNVRLKLKHYRFAALLKFLGLSSPFCARIMPVSLLISVATKYSIRRNIFLILSFRRVIKLVVQEGATEYRRPIIDYCLSSI